MGGWLCARPRTRGHRCGEVNESTGSQHSSRALKLSLSAQTDRRSLQLAGYEVYRFGFWGYELRYETAGARYAPMTRSSLALAPAIYEFAAARMFPTASPEARPIPGCTIVISNERATPSAR